MKLTLKVWRQKNSKDKGRFETYNVTADHCKQHYIRVLLIP